MNVIFVFLVSQLIIQIKFCAASSILDVVSKSLSKDEIVKYIKEKGLPTLVAFKELKPSVKDQYLVQFKDESSMINVLSKIKAGKIPFDPTFVILHSYPQISTINVKMSAFTLIVFRNLPEVKLIESDGIASIVQQTCPSQANALFCLSRSSDYTGNSPDYKYPNVAGNLITVHVLDTGVNISHPDFGGRATQGVSFVAEEQNEDTHGHGTVCASLVMGNDCGTAKLTKVVSVKVLNKEGKGSYGAIIAGMYWAANNNRNGILSMSLGGGKSDILNFAVDNIFEFYGSFIAVAAGNEGQNAGNTSPASAARAFTVAASDSYNRFASFSNYGSVVDIIAPGVQCFSAYYKGGYTFATGTSMATPLVAGWAAILKSSDINQNATTIMNRIIQYSVKNVIYNVPAGTPNQFINVRCPLSASQ